MPRYPHTGTFRRPVGSGSHAAGGAYTPPGERVLYEGPCDVQDRRRELVPDEGGGQMIVSDADVFVPPGVLGTPLAADAVDVGDRFESAFGLAQVVGVRRLDDKIYVRYQRRKARTT